MSGLDVNFKPILFCFVRGINDILSFVIWGNLQGANHWVVPSPPAWPDWMKGMPWISERQQDFSAARLDNGWLKCVMAAMMVFTLVPGPAVSYILHSVSRISSVFQMISLKLVLHRPYGPSNCIFWLLRQPDSHLEKVLSSNSDVEIIKISVGWLAQNMTDPICYKHRSTRLSKLRNILVESDQNISADDLLR